MEIKAIVGDITQLDVGAIIVNLFEGVHTPGGATGAVDRSLDGAISSLIEEGEIRGKKGELTLIHTLDKIAPHRVLIVGLGNREQFDRDGVRFVSGEALRYLRRLGVQRIATIAHGAGIGGMDPQTSAQAIAEGSILGLYKFDKYLDKKENSKDIKEVLIVESSESKISALGKGMEKGRVFAQATNLCRDMVNEPANFMNPGRMAMIARELAAELGLEIRVLERAQMEELGMGGLLGVARGSEQPPKLIILQYWGDPGNQSNNLGLVGKGITFDTGGISLKPAAEMGEMKGDMAGGASVIAAMKAIGVLKPKINVTAIVPATENMPGGSAQRPGDVIRAMNGKSIEVENTDAEGRLILADALCYARHMGITRLIDVATLTGAMTIALGHVYSGVFTNNQELCDQVLRAGKASGERIWQMPMHEEYKEQNKSSVAEIKNTGGRPAGSITAAQFLAEFVDDTPWVHLDIAGTSRTDKERGYNTKGATGVPVRTLINLVLDLSQG
ncbi:MAG: leucyl aminopeptidase [Chloroflexi bacterium]|nr:leucyl aminopeptidase [Chloroflexota bacterium]